MDDVRNVLEEIKKTISPQKSLIESQLNGWGFTDKERDFKKGKLDGLSYAIDCIDEFLKEKMDG